MTCWNAKRRSADYVDGRLRDSERSRLESHLDQCESCSLQIEQVRSVRMTLQRLPGVSSPAKLKTALRVHASLERQAVLSSQGSRFARIWKRWKFRFNEIMRPLTIPATGGVLSSLMLFGALALAISTTSQIVQYEVPVLYADHVDATLVPLELRSSIMLTLSLDGHGRITDYSARDDYASFVGDASRLQYNAIALPDFPSVMAVAQPISSDIRILVRPIVYRQ